MKLDLRISCCVPISDRFFKVFSEFKALKKLTLYLPHIETVNASVESFKHCKQLKYLDITYPELREDFFANIASFVPKLQFLQILTEKQYSDSFINSFDSMNSIQRVNLFVDNGKQTNENLWYFGKCLSEVMSSPMGKNVIRVNDNCGLTTYYSKNF